MDVRFSGKPSWDDAYTWTLTSLAVVSYLGADWLPRLLFDRLPPGWDPRVRICVNPLGGPLTDRIQMKPGEIPTEEFGWKRIDSRYDPSYPASIEEPLEEIGVPFLNEVAHRLWSDMLFNLGFLHFESDLEKVSQDASQEVGDFIDRWSKQLVDSGVLGRT